MKIFYKGIAVVLFYVIAGALLVYAAARSLDFINSTLPPDQQIIGYLALAATSGGMIAWGMVFLHKAEGPGQKITAAIMTVVDMLGEGALFTFDTLYQTGQSGMIEQMPAEEIRMVVLGLSGLIFLNIMATMIYHMAEPENIKNMREHSVRDRLEDEALKLIEKRGEEMAQDLAPKIAEQWARDFENRFSDLRALGLGKMNTPIEKEDQPLGQGPRLPWRKAPPPPTPLPPPHESEFGPEAQDVAHDPLSGFGKNGNGHHHG